MVIEIVEQSVTIIKKNPKTALPYTLSWIPAAMLNLIVLIAAMDLSGYLTPENIILTLRNIPLILKLIVPYLLASVPVIILMILVSIFLEAVYPFLVQQYFLKKRVLISVAFSPAKSRFLPLLWSYTLLFLLLIVAFIPLVFLLFAGLFGLLLAVIGFFIIGITAALAYWLLNTVVVLENLSGLKAIRRSFDISKRFFLQTVALVTILSIILIVVSLSFGSVPKIGFILSMIASLFTYSLFTISRTVFYYNYEKKKRLK